MQLRYAASQLTVASCIVPRGQKPARWPQCALGCAGANVSACCRTSPREYITCRRITGLQLHNTTMPAVGPLRHDMGLLRPDKGLSNVMWAYQMRRGPCQVWN